MTGNSPFEEKNQIITVTITPTKNVMSITFVFVKYAVPKLSMNKMINVVKIFNNFFIV